jgi:small conductance mechanosensitive channel
LAVQFYPDLGGFTLRALQEVAAQPDSLGQGGTVDGWPAFLSMSFFTSLGIGVIRVVSVVAVALILLRIVDRSTRRWTRRFDDRPALDPSRQRALTLGNLIVSAARYVIWPVSIIMVLSIVGVDVAALIATAGIAGLAVGFGAQTLVKDVISGFFLLFDNTIAIGDNVRIGDEKGIVEHIGLRLIKVRKYNGELMMVPAGELRIFANASIGFARAIVEVGVAYKDDIDQVLEILSRVARTWMDANRSVLESDEPDIHAITSFGDSSVNVRIGVAVSPGEQWRSERELRIAIKAAFDEAGIDIPFPNQIVHMITQPAPGGA